MMLRSVIVLTLSALPSLDLQQGSPAAQGAGPSPTVADAQARLATDPAGAAKLLESIVKAASRR